MKALLAVLRRRAAVVWLATVVLVALGLDAARKMPSGIYPEVEFPRIVVVARSGGAPPDVFLTSVTRPLEQALTTVLGVQRIRSKTIRGSTEIYLQFTPGTDMWRALQLVESRVSENRSSLPQDVEIEVERITTGSFPVVTFNLSGPIDPRELRELAQYVVRPALGSVAGVGRIDVLGGDVREVEVVLDPEATAALHLTPDEVADKLRTAMGLDAVGRIDRDRQLVTVLGDAQPKTIADIREMPIARTPTGNVVPLYSIAEVFEGAEDRFVRVGGPHGETVSMSVARIPGASTPDVVDEAIAVAKTVAKSLPAGVTLVPVYDQALLVRESMASVRDAIVIGIFLCAGVIALFLRDLRAGVLAAISVPITLAITFVFMRMANQTLNLMSLGGMAVAIGLVVDDAIVMIEAIARHRDRGSDVGTASVEGTVELAPAVIGTTLTTVVVFVPLAFLQGIVGDFFRALAFTLTTAVLISLAVAIMLVPLAASFGMSSAIQRRTPSAPPGHVKQRALERVYEKVMQRFVRAPILASILLIGTVVAGVLLAHRVQRGFLPTMDEGAFVLDYFLPAGTSLGTTEQFARDIEAELKATPEVRTFTRRTGAELGPVAATELNRGDVMVSLVPRGKRSRSADDVIADLRERLSAKYPEIRIEFVQVLQDVLNDLSGSPRPVEVKLYGPDYGKLHEIGDALASKLEHVQGLVDLYDGHERDAPALDFTMKRDEIARLGTNPVTVSAQLQSSLRGAIVGTIRRYDRLINIRSRFPNRVRFDPARVLDLPFTISERSTTFRAVVGAEDVASPSLLLHESLQPLVTVTGDHEHRDLGSISDEVDKIVGATPIPSGYRVALGGQIEGERATVKQLASVGGFALLLVLTVLAGQFKRMRVAILVLVTVPVAIVGAIFGLLATGTPLNASSLMGCVLLVGLVVKNGVLLLEEAEKLAESEPADRAVVLAGDRRVRPVLMTTLATLAGLFPLALGIGAGAELQRPLAIAVIGGLLTSTIATLAFLPPLAALVLRRKTAR